MSLLAMLSAILVLAVSVGASEVAFRLREQSVEQKIRYDEEEKGK